MLTRKRKRDYELEQFQSGCCKFRKHPLLEWFHHTYQQSAMFQPLTSFPRPFLVYHDKKKIRMSNKLQYLLNSAHHSIVEHIYDVDHNTLYFIVQKDAKELTYHLYQWNISSQNNNIHHIEIPSILEYTFDTMAFDSQRRWLIHYSISLQNCLLLTIRDASQHNIPILYQIQLVFDYKGRNPLEMELPEMPEFELHFEPHTQTLFLYSCECHWYEEFKNHVDDTELQSRCLCILFSLSLKDHDLIPFRYSNTESLFVPQKIYIHLEHHELNLYLLWSLTNINHFYGIKSICYHPRQKQYYLIVYHRFQNSQVVSSYYCNDIELQFYPIFFSNSKMSVSVTHVDSIPIVTQHDVSINSAFYFRFGSFQNFPLLTMSTFPCPKSQFPQAYINFFQLDNKNFQNNIQFDLRNPTSKLLVQMYYEYQKYDDSQCIFSYWIHHPIFDLELLFLLLDYISLF
jgi:hypothetical protein